MGGGARADPDLVEDLKVHKPYLDAITYDSPFAPGARMRRVSDVIDCWYDSGAMPFAQWGYPHQNRQRFAEQFPADFISEALDQTRGWFYSLLAISTLVFEEAAYPHPFENCIVLGLMLAEWWESPDRQIFLSEEGAAGRGAVAKKVGKMSKQLRNYRSPQEIFDTHGADALRWYFFANQPPWTSVIYSERAIRESIPEFLLRLWNVYSFFVVYANIDGFDPAAEIGGEVGDADAAAFERATSYRPAAARDELDRWILAELQATIEAVIERMDAYDNFAACQRLQGLVEGLSNWYVRRSRERFWSGDARSLEKLDAYWTLYEVLLTTTRLIAPFVPFVAEALWRNLTGVLGSRVTESVHLANYPAADASRRDGPLIERMALLREIASLGRAARTDARLKVRQPLPAVTVVLRDDRDRPWLEAHEELLRRELNVDAVQYTTEAGELVSYRIVPNFKRLGPRVGRLMPQLKQALAEADGARLLEALRQHGRASIAAGTETVELDAEDLDVQLQAAAGRAAAQGRRCVVVLETELTPELIRRGMANDIIRLIQDLRKERRLQFTDRIRVTLATEDPELRQAIDDCRGEIAAETLATAISDRPADDSDARRCEVAGRSLLIDLQVDSDREAVLSAAVPKPC